MVMMEHSFSGVIVATTLQNEDTTVRSLVSYTLGSKIYSKGNTNA